MQRRLRILSLINHIVVIYQENHSFDNLYGRWEGVNGLRHAPRSRTVQVNQAGEPYDCLLQNDVNLTACPTPTGCRTARVCPAAAPATWSTASTRSSTSSTTAARTGT